VRQLHGHAYVKQSVILNYQVCHDKTSGGCYIPTHCPRLSANVTATLSPPIRLPFATRSVNKSYRTCDACRTTAVLLYVRPAFLNSYPVPGVCGRRREGQTCMRVGRHVSPPVPACLSAIKSPLVSLRPRHPLPMRRRLTGTCQEPEHRRTGGRHTRRRSLYAVVVGRVSGQNCSLVPMEVLPGTLVP